VCDEKKLKKDRKTRNRSFEKSKCILTLILFDVITSELCNTEKKKWI
jgi:hypothetical protein